MTHRELIRNDCLDTFIEGDIEAGSVDLIYLDPPFNSNQRYNLPFKKLGKDTKAVDAFKDIWNWDEPTQDSFDQLKDGEYGQEGKVIKQYIDNIRHLRGGWDNMTAYLTNMAIRLFAMRRVLKPTGSIYLHCDPTASHYLKIMMDGIWGSDNFRNEIVWCYRKLPNKSIKFQSNHDTILFYSKSKDITFNTQFDEPTAGSQKTFESAAKRGYNTNLSKKMVTVFDWDKYHKAVQSGKIPSDLKPTEFQDGKPPMKDWWSDIKILGGPYNKERLGYPTQKPLRLLERIITTSSNEGDLVLDPFCGCGTTVHAAENLGRQWIGIDISRFAIGVMKNRLKQAFSENQAFLDSIKFSGLPTTPEDAQQLARDYPFEFEKWVCGHIGAIGLYKNPGQKGADGGIDGVLEFYPEAKQKAYAIVQVKGGGVKPNDVKALFNDVDKEPEATAGIFVCFEKYRKTFENNRNSKQFKDKIAGNQWPVIQLLTIEEMLAGKEVKLPNLINPIERKNYKIKKQKKLI